MQHRFRLGFPSKVASDDRTALSILYLPCIPFIISARTLLRSWLRGTCILVRPRCRV